MQRKNSPEANGQPFSATTVKQPQWPIKLGLALSVGLTLPAASNWLAILAQRPWADNAPPILTGIFLLFAMARKGKPRLPAWQPSSFGALALMLTGILYLLGIWLSIKVVMFAGLIALLAALGWACCGKTWLYRAWPGFLFALFLLPQFPTDLRTTISLPLQLISTQLATGLASLFIPVQTMGNIFYIKGEAFEVTSACSGLNTWVGYLFAGMLAMLMDRFSPGRLGRLMLGAPVLALGENAIRLWITALVAYWVSPDAGSAIHTNIEYVLFPLGLLVMVLAEQQIERRFPLPPALHPEANQAEASASPAASAGLNNPPAACPNPDLTPPRTSSALTWAIVSLLLIINAGAWLGNGPLPESTATPTTAVGSPVHLPPVPYQVGAWHGTDLPLEHDERAILAPATVISREYSIGDAQAGQPLLWMNLIEATSVNHLHNMVDSLVASGMKPKLAGTIIIQTSKGPLKTSWFRCVEADGKPFNLLLWYEWDGGNAENRWAWYWNVLNLKLQKRQPVWRMVEIASPGSPLDRGPDQSRRLEQLKAFAAEFYPATIP